MDLVERKANIQRTVAQIKHEIEAIAERRETLIAHMNGLLGQIHLIDQLLAENPPSDPAPPDGDDIEGAAEAAMEGAIKDE